MQCTQVDGSLFLCKMTLMNKKKKEIDQKTKKTGYYLESLSKQKIDNKFASK